jgi:TetR/AcrR family transcriptional regulator, cholesterol catabolism regulator
VPDRASLQFDGKLEGILRSAAQVFCARGYDRAGIRDISRATGISLSGLYYYFSSKEHLLYLIQRHAFGTLLAEARQALASLAGPEDRLRAFVRLHLKFFIEHPNEMKVLTHEESALGDEWRREIHAMKKNYYRLCFGVVERLREERRLTRLNARLAVLSLFGMMNWIYTWYNPKVDPDSATMADEMTEIFLSGVLGAGFRRGRSNGASRQAGFKARTNGSARPAARNGANGSARRSTARLRA